MTILWKDDDLCFHVEGEDSDSEPSEAVVVDDDQDSISTSGQ